MSFRPSSFGTVFLALGLGLSFPGAALAAPDPTPIQIQVSPACPQPGGLLHVTILASSPEYRSHMLSSPEYRAAFFDIFIDARFRPAFFDIFFEDYLKSRPAFFDIFTELTLGPGTGPVTLQKLTPICGFLTLDSIEMLVQRPTSGGGGGAGGLGGLGGVISLRRGDTTLASAPMMPSSSASPIPHTLSSGEALSSFFDVFTEWGIARNDRRSPQPTRVMALDANAVLRKAGDAETTALRLLYENDGRASLARDLLRCLQNDLSRQVITALGLGR
jgi:hypothetical protein